jgi:hypothetical protein
MLHKVWPNFTHNLFKPLLLFFYPDPDPQGAVRVPVPTPPLTPAVFEQLPSWVRSEGGS